MLRLLKRKYHSFIFQLRYRKEQALDKIRGVDFTSPMGREEAGISELEDSQYYGTTSCAPELTDALDLLKIQNSDSILDYGSGKGAVLVKFHQYPFKKVTGVEFSQKLVDICLSNLEKLKINDIEVFSGDAASFTLIDEFNYFYLANPFTGGLFETVINNIIRSGDRNRRKLFVLYYNPKCHDVVMNTGRFSIFKDLKYGARRLVIYKFLTQGPAPGK